MAQTNILCPQTVPAFTLTTDDPMFYTEFCNWTISKNLEAMAAAGLQWTDGVPDDLESAWTIQTTLLTQQNGILSSLAQTSLSAGWAARVSGLQAMITSLQGLMFNSENYRVRDSMIAIIEESIQTMTISPSGDNVLEYRPSVVDFPLAAWTQQTAAIDEQSAYFLHVKDILGRKEEELPNESSESVIGTLISNLLGEMAEEGIYVGLKYLLSWLTGLGGGATAVVAFLTVVGLLTLKDLWDRYVMGQTMCQSFKDENDALRNLDITDGEGNTDNAKAWEYYRLREQVIGRHNDQIHNLLTEIIALEEQTKESIGQPGGSNEELIQAVRELGNQSYEIEAEDFRIRKLGRTLTAGSW